MPSLIDTHSHIFVDTFEEDIDQVIERARAAGVAKIVVPATKPSEFEAIYALKQRFPEVEVAIGVHPHHASEVDESDLEAIERLGSEGGAIAIGEIGLDYYYDFSPKEQQHKIFREQLRIAKRLDLPVIVHNRESDVDLLDIIENEQDGSLRFQLHCFSSDEATLSRALSLGGMISFTGNITYKKSTLDEIVRLVPDSRIMIETDAPYLTPVPYRGRRNEPGYVALVAEKLATIRGATLDEIKLMTTANAQQFFRLSILAIILILSFGGVAEAQPQTTPPPVRVIDTTTPPDPPFEKLVGIGGHLASSTYITGALTSASATGYGVWLSVAPLQPIGVNWLQVDLIYTLVNVPGPGFDSAYFKLGGTAPVPGNIHNTFDISFRATANSRKLITFFASLGATYFHNEFSLDKFLIEHSEFDKQKYQDYQESLWGLSGSLGLSLNFDTPYGTISPTGEWRYSSILQERTLPQRKIEFSVSQPRIGVIFYPSFSKLF